MKSVRTLVFLLLLIQICSSSNALAAVGVTVHPARAA
jgi:hypothetical protein